MDAAAPGTALVAGATITVLAVAGKLAGGYLGAKLNRLYHWEGLAFDAALHGRGIVEVGVANIGLGLHRLTTSMYAIVLPVAVVTSAVAAPLLRWSMRRVGTHPAERAREAELAAWSQCSPARPEPL